MESARSRRAPAALPLLQHAVSALIPLGWLVAMGVSTQGAAAEVMAFAAFLLCIAVVMTRSLDTALLVPTGRNVVLGLAGAAVMIGGTYAGFAALTRFIPSLRRDISAVTSHLDGGAVSVLLVTAVVVAEELVWRGAFQSFVRRFSSGEMAAVIASAATYALAMISFGSPLLVGVALACGLYWGLLRSWTNSVVPPLIAHVVWNLALGLLPLR